MADNAKWARKRIKKRNDQRATSYLNELGSLASLTGGVKYADIKKAAGDPGRAFVNIQDTGDAGKKGRAKPVL